MFEVQNVNNQTGNIYFNGAVLVRENALNGFQIRADGGDVEVYGVVEGAYIENSGNIIIRRGECRAIIGKQLKLGGVI